MCESLAGSGVSFILQYEPLTVHGMDKFLRIPFINRLAQVIDVHINKIGSGVKIVFPYILRNLSPCNDFPFQDR
jgi:hypothetical protein